MSIAYTITAVVLSLVLVGSGRGKLVRDPRVTEGMSKAQVPQTWYAPLALVEFAGALGLLIGIAWRPLGVAAAIGVVLYFVGAVLAHLRAKDTAGAGVPGAILLLAIVVLVLGASSA